MSSIDQMFSEMFGDAPKPDAKPESKTNAVAPKASTEPKPEDDFLSELVRDEQAEATKPDPVGDAAAIVAAWVAGSKSERVACERIQGIASLVGPGHGIIAKGGQFSRWSQRPRPFTKPARDEVKRAVNVLVEHLRSLPGKDGNSGAAMWLQEFGRRAALGLDVSRSRYGVHRAFAA